MQSARIMSKQPKKGEEGANSTLSLTSFKTVHGDINHTIDCQTDKN